MATDDPFDLDRFINAQELCYPQVLRELRSGLQDQPLDVVHLSATRGTWIQRDVEILCAPVSR
ncbi:hypothetical protein [Novosphingobium aerophilum]|uniref:hypothetical protein n=1 Tax=Novosphingobium aerophilum TaxID=2839843 RepID=UPI002E287AA0|nr:hypothetical protein [Novosphingobium aerophilum]